jgi:hypothetical protein
MLNPRKGKNLIKLLNNYGVYIKWGGVVNPFLDSADSGTAFIFLHSIPLLLPISAQRYHLNILG